ncbi:MAG: T9SS type A sorting domain-containing protein [Bacteroidetes bacterium]|nr:T9SS type A sorting domain-containing protein [Bacteroidota bacterium]
MIFANGAYNLTDTVAVPSYPLWFMEDMRCYVGMNEINSRLAIHAKPNPATEEISISITGLQNEVAYTFEIISMSGELLFELPVYPKKEYRIPLDEMPTGTLLMRISGNGVSVTKRIIKL